MFSMCSPPIVATSEKGAVVNLQILPYVVRSVADGADDAQGEARLASGTSVNALVTVPVTVMRFHVTPPTATVSYDKGHWKGGMRFPVWSQKHMSASIFGRSLHGGL